MIAKEKLWSILKILLKILVTSVLLYFVFRKIDIRELKSLIPRSNPYLIAIALLTYASSIFIASWRSLVLLRSIGMKLGYWYYFKLYMLGIMYNVILPGGVGGDGYKIYILRKKFDMQTRRLFLAMLFDRLSGFWAIVFLMLGLVVFIPGIGIHPVIPLLLQLGGTAVYYFIMKRFFGDYSRQFFSVHLKAFVLQCTQLFTVVFILCSQGFKGSFQPYLFSFQLSTLAANVPAGLPGGVGLREYAMVNVARFLGMDQQLALFVSFTFYLITLAVALAGIYFMVRYSNEFERAPASKMAREFEKNADRSV